MSLSEKEIDLIQQSFQKVVPIKDKAAEIFYDKLFLDEPKLKPLFKSGLKTQGEKLMATLGVAVNALRDLDALVPVLENLAIKHVDYGVKAEDYAPVGNALIYTLGQGLGEGFTAEVKAAWEKLYAVVVSVMCSAAYGE